MAKIGKDWGGLRDRLYGLRDRLYGLRDRLNGFTVLVDYVQTLQTQRTKC